MIFPPGHGDVDIAVDERWIQIAGIVILFFVQGPALSHVDAEGGNGVISPGEGRRAVSLVGIHVNHPDRLDPLFGLQFTDGNHDIVKHTKALAKIFLTVMHAAGVKQNKNFFPEPIGSTCVVLATILRIRSNNRTNGTVALSGL